MNFSADIVSIATVTSNSYRSETTETATAPGKARAIKVALVGGYAPRRCGIATFTTDVVAALDTAFPAAMIDVYPVAPEDERIEICAPVRRGFVKHAPETYRSVAKDINASGADVIWLQHEFGLFGGKAGAMIFELLDGVAAPLIVTLHTVLPDPDKDQHDVMQKIIGRASRIIVMSQLARQLMLDVYHCDADQIVVVPHGVPDRPFGRSRHFKEKYGFADHPLMMTFGLMSPGKGIETAIAALPKVIERFPGATYCIVGATHPDLFATDGEAYRDSLVKLSADLGVENNIRWINAFLDLDTLLEYIEAADIYITPYAGMAQATSGTLSYAAALGKAVVSTPYPHAQELLADGHGILFPAGDADALSDALADLLEHPAKIAMLQQRAYQRGRSMLWSSFAARSMAIMHEVTHTQCAANLAQIVDIENLPALGHTGLSRMCDDTGILQHSVFSVPDRAHGYCVDDNARALLLANRMPHFGSDNFPRRAPVFAAFIQHAWNPDTRSFRNFMGFGRNWLESTGSEDSNGRTLWAIGATCAQGGSPALQKWAHALYKVTAPHALEFGSPRAIAFAMLGAAHVLQTESTHHSANQILQHGGAALERLLRASSRPDWTWFEIVLSYDNCRLAEALIRAGSALNRADWTECGLQTLAWITRKQTNVKQQFRPVGSEGFGRMDSHILPFDQQPVEAWATIDACAAAFEVSGNAEWINSAKAAYAWFFGRNDRGIALADIQTGSCRDGLTPRGINENEGAESVLALHLAHSTMQRLRAHIDNVDLPFSAHSNSR